MKFSFGNLIANNIITDNGDDGVEFYGAMKNTVAGNRVLNNGVGIKVDGNPDALSAITVKNNLIEANYVGIYLGYESRDSEISYNTIKSNTRGIEVDRSQANIVHHNNFIEYVENTVIHDPVFDDPYYANYWTYSNWDNGTEGNYWSDYAGADDNSDGIGDLPFELDHYPLISSVNFDIQFTLPQPQPIQPVSSASPSPRSQDASDALSPLDIILALIASLFIGIVLAILVVRIEHRLKTKSQKRTGKHV